MSPFDALTSLGSLVGQERGSCSTSRNWVAFPYHWQVPAATEKAAFESVVESDGLQADALYVGYPWATLIDALRRRSAKLPDLLHGLKSLADVMRERPRRGAVVTVAQHIHARQFLPLFRALGITDICWSHAVRGDPADQEIALHPFPLFPAQAPLPVAPEERGRSKRHLANFIGAYNPGLYLSNVRGVIFADAGRFSDLLILKRDAWHFDRSVYVEQMHGVSATHAQSEREAAEAREYLDAIRDSWFTLCPTGSGPNSIRLFESLALGSIPILLTKALLLPGPDQLWQRSTIIEEDSEQGYRRALERARSMPESERNAMLAAGAELFAIVRPSRFAQIVSDQLLAKERQA
jgi:hypothetical protein